MVDRPTKIILALIAAGLWAHLFVGVLRPALAAQDVTAILNQINQSLGAIYQGICLNRKICGP